MKNTIALSAGSVEYSREEAETSIDEMIQMLQAAKDDGATHVVGLSGNYRGAKWVRLGTDVEWLEDGDDEGQY